MSTLLECLLWQRVRAIAAIMTGCKIMGAKGGKLLKYATSGDTGENKDSVVGYASISFT